MVIFVNRWTRPKATWSPSPSMLFSNRRQHRLMYWSTVAWKGFKSFIIGVIISSLIIIWFKSVLVSSTLRMRRERINAVAVGISYLSSLVIVELDLLANLSKKNLPTLSWVSFNWDPATKLILIQLVPILLVPSRYWPSILSIDLSGKNQWCCEIAVLAFYSGRILPTINNHYLRQKLLESHQPTL